MQRTALRQEQGVHRGASVFAFGAFLQHQLVLSALQAVGQHHALGRVALHPNLLYPLAVNENVVIAFAFV